MTIDLAGFIADTTAILGDWGETVTIQRLAINYATVPPTETWTDSGTVSMEIQPSSGNLSRSDPGLLSERTHLGIAAYNAGLLANDKIIRSGDTNYYLILRVEDWEDHLEVWMKYVAGAV
jgi:hypothetical protein